MNFYFYKTDKMPDCKTCKKPMGWWSPFMEEYECTDCMSDRISNAMISVLEKQLEPLTTPTK